MAAAFVQGAAVTASGNWPSVTLAAAPTAGNILIAQISQRADPYPSTPGSGWTYVDQVQATGSEGGYTWLMYHVVGAGETATTTPMVVGNASNAVRLYVGEFSGVGSYDSHGTATGSGTAISASVTPTAGDAALIVGLAAHGGFSAAAYTPGTGFTELDDGAVGGGTIVEFEYKVVGSTTGTYTTPSTIGSSEIWGAIAAAFTNPPESAVLADWDNDGFGTLGTYDDLSSYVASWRITRGASPELTGGAQPGQMTLVLNNPTDNRFNPENTGGPLYGKLRDGVPIWVGVNSDGVLGGTAVRGLFGGRIVDITPILSGGAAYPPHVEITAEDDLGRLSRSPVRIADSRSRSQGSLRTAILSAGTVYASSLPPEITTMPLSGGNGYALTLLEQLNTANGTRHFISPADSASGWYTYTAKDRYWHLSGVAQGTADAGSQHVTGTDGWRRSADTIINQQTVSFDPVDFTVGLVTTWQATTVPFTYSTDQTFWVQYDDFVDSPSVALTYTGSTATSTLTSFGDTAKLVLHSAGTSTITSLEIQGYLARRSPTQSYVANNTTSQADPRGTRAGTPISGDYVGVAPSAQGIAEHIVWRFGNPQYRPTLTVQNWLPTMFDLDLFDVIAVTSSQLGVTARLFEIVGLTLQSDLAAATGTVHHTATYVLQECRVQTATNWFQTDSSLLDGTHLLGY